MVLFSLIVNDDVLRSLVLSSILLSNHAFQRIVGYCTGGSEAYWSLWNYLLRICVNEVNVQFKNCFLTEMSTQRADSSDATVVFQNDVKNEVREIGDQAVWSLSSCKPGFGIDQLRDDNFDTYWQSDGPQPHLVNIQFRC